jgi:hypothetical protein
VVLGALPLSETRRYRAPTEEGVLSFPPELDIAAQLEANRERLEQTAVRIDGQPLAKFREEARREVLAFARRYLAERGEPVPDFPDGPLLMSGHQPELSHVGVLVKTFALHGLARRHRLTPVNLIVDNDTTKSTALRFAVVDPDPDAVHSQSVAYDRFEGEVTYEQREVVDPNLFDSFDERALPLTKNWGFEPLLPRVWEVMRAWRRRTPILGEIVSATRREFERRMGCHNLELPLSRMCATEAFQRFAKHLAGDLARFHAIYNESVAVYRRIHHIRGRNHPVPDLGRNGETLEAPFWRMRPGQERRARVMLAPGQIPAGADLRSRALTTTMFMRLVLADGFIHGIGGAKYDEVTNAIIQKWLGLEPPEIIVVTATFRLALPSFPRTSETVRDLDRQLRDAWWNPQRHVDGEQTRATDLRNAKEALIAGEPTSRRDRKEWFRQLQTTTAELRPFATTRLELLRHQRAEAIREAKANEALIRRDFAWCLFPEERLRTFCQKLL